MKKQNFDKVKSSMYSWLIAFVVAIVIVAVVVGVSFGTVGLQCREVASADVSSLVTGEIYIFDTPVSTTLNVISTSTQSTTNIGGYVFSKNHSYIFDNISFTQYVNNNTTYMEYRISFLYQNSSVFYLKYYATYGSSPYSFNITNAEWFVNNYGSESLSDNYFGFQFLSDFTNVPASGNWWNKFRRLISLMPSGPNLFPVDDFLIVDAATSIYGMQDLYFDFYEITNASSHADSNGVVYVDIYYAGNFYENKYCITTDR